MCDTGYITDEDIAEDLPENKEQCQTLSCVRAKESSKGIANKLSYYYTNWMLRQPVMYMQYQLVSANNEPVTFFRDSLRNIFMVHIDGVDWPIAPMHIFPMESYLIAFVRGPVGAQRLTYQGRQCVYKLMCNSYHRLSVNMQCQLDHNFNIHLQTIHLA